MATPEQHCNLALAKLVHKDRINTLAAPTLPLERHFALIYPHYRDVELAKHPWRFAQSRWKLVQTVGELEETDLPYVYDFADDMLTLRREKRSDWLIQGRTIATAEPDFIWVTGTKRVSEAYFDPLFVDVLVHRLALETCDWPGIPEGKRQLMLAGYQEAERVAGKQNAWLVEPHDTEGDDDQFSWIYARAV
jgi:hypothetical protein